MKIRTGHVSNSSSSSFIVIGISTQIVNIGDIVKMAKKDGEIDYDDHGILSGENFDYIWSCFPSTDHADEITDPDTWVGKGESIEDSYEYMPEYVGVTGSRATSMLEDMNLKEARIEVAKSFQKMGLNIDPKNINIYYGECSNGG